MILQMYNSYTGQEIREYVEDNYFLCDYCEDDIAEVLHRRYFYNDMCKLNDDRSYKIWSYKSDFMYPDGSFGLNTTYKLEKMLFQLGRRR